MPQQTHRDAKHEEKKPYNCAHCEESFAQKRKLHVHVQAVHTGKNEFACEQCDASYTEYRKLSDFIKEYIQIEIGIFFFFFFLLSCLLIIHYIIYLKSFF